MMIAIKTELLFIILGCFFDSKRFIPLRAKPCSFPCLPVDVSVEIPIYTAVSWFRRAGPDWWGVFIEAHMSNIVICNCLSQLLGLSFRIKRISVYSIKLHLQMWGIGQLRTQQILQVHDLLLDPQYYVISFLQLLPQLSYHFLLTEEARAGFWDTWWVWTV